ncbi:restriction endonuclease [Streptomyces sp. NPDC093795]|uniref:restriction endonuclease n=1 Tax=Streptomyces sp. NPDC093795 TaxID=3366051 RepID=UPI0037FA52EC
MVSAESGDEDHEELSLVELAARVQRAELPVPVQNPQKLPLDQLDPEVFERLVAEIVSRRDHRGVSFYGRRGQKQYGLDIVEREPDLRRTLYQVKRYSTLTESLLKTAVKEYAGAPRRPGHGLPPRRFDPHRFVVVTSAEIESDTHLVDAIHALQKTYEDAEDLHIEVWGVEELGRRTRDAVSLVSAVLGEAWARAWCGMTSGSRDDAAPAPMGLVSAPLATLGLSDVERRAGALQDTSPAEAARLYRQLADALEQKNFPVTLPKCARARQP